MRQCAARSVAGAGVTEIARLPSSNALCRARLRPRSSRRARCRHTRRPALGSAWLDCKPRLAGSLPRWPRCTRRPWANRLPPACSARTFGTRRCSMRRTFRRSRHTSPSSSKRWISRRLAPLRHTRRLWRCNAPRPCRPRSARNLRWKQLCNDRPRRCIDLASHTGSSVPASRPSSPRSAGATALRTSLRTSRTARPSHTG